MQVTIQSVLFQTDKSLLVTGRDFSKICSLFHDIISHVPSCPFHSCHIPSKFLSVSLMIEATPDTSGEMVGSSLPCCQIQPLDHLLLQKIPSY